MTATDAARIVVVGEALVDIVYRPSGVGDEAPGGSPANVALTLGRLGRTPRLVTCLGDDDRGRRVRRWLEESGVAVTAISARRTATAAAHLDETGAARYAFDLQWDLGGQGASAAGHADVVHTGSVAAVLEPGASEVAVLVRAARSRAIITYDPNIRPALVDDPVAVRARVDELVGLADVVKASDEDLRWLHPGRNLEEVAQEWQQRGAAIVVVTLGAAGALAVTDDGIVRVPAVPAAVVDTVGAGDTFMGTLLDGLVALGGSAAALRAPGGGIRLDDLETILRRCALAASITVSRPGADPPRAAELDLRGAASGAVHTH
ncbi:carbohydrate kinase [Microbacterium sp. 2FI]|uniref:carbohydrate kinase family protein n=1 Tax=Microbacterium sp. 2FI TaxID=2502193 RepID=UPI0010F99533|nr:carbohydrate kinase [Microbacterium sp. 2FI]